MQENTSHQYLGKWKHQNVYTYYDKNNKHWVIYIKHSYFGDLIHIGLPRKPKLGKAKTLFKDRLRELNEQEKLKNERNAAETYQLVRDICGEPTRMEKYEGRNL